MISAKQTALLAILTLSCNPGMMAQEPSWHLESSSLETTQRLVLANENGYSIFEIAEILQPYQTTVEAHQVTITNNEHITLTIVYSQETKLVKISNRNGFQTMYPTEGLETYVLMDIIQALDNPN